MRSLTFSVVSLSLLLVVASAGADDASGKLSGRTTSPENEVVTDAIEKRGDEKETAKQADIRRMMELSGAGKLGAQMMQQMLGQFRQIHPEVPAEFWDEVSAAVDGDELIALVVPIYDQHFTHDEIKELIAFYETPIGKKLIEKQPTIMQQSMSAGQIWGQKLAESIVERMKARGF